jgi:hypothetical protein
MKIGVGGFGKQLHQLFIAVYETETYCNCEYVLAINMKMDYTTR